MRHEGLPERYCRAPDHAHGKGDREIPERVFPDVVFALGGLLFNKLAELKDRKQQPAPDEIVGDPVGPLLADDVHHTRNHEHIRRVADKRFQAGDPADLQKVLPPTDIELLPGEHPDVLLMQQQERNDEKQDVHDDVRIADAVHAEVHRDRQSGYKEGIEDDRQHKSGSGQYVDVPASIQRNQRDERELREN